MMIMEIDLPGNVAVSLEGKMIKYWRGCGLPEFVGTIDEFSEFYPDVFLELVNIGAVKWNC